MQNSYYCDICQISFSSSQNLAHHKKTAKHLNNVNVFKKPDCFKDKLAEMYKKFINESVACNRVEVEKLIGQQHKFISKTTDDDKYLCTLCNIEFKKIKKYKEHLLICKPVDEEFHDLKKLCVDLTIKLIDLQNQSKKQIQDLQAKITQLEQSVTTNHTTLVSELAKQIVSTGAPITINGVVNHKVINNNNQNIQNTSNKNKFKQCDVLFNNAPPLIYENIYLDSQTKLPYNYEKYKNQTQMHTILNDNSHLSDEKKYMLYNASLFIMAWKNNTLEKYIATKLVNKYKKDDPQQQSAWNTDSSRATYILRHLNDKKDCFWKYDKKAIEFKKSIVAEALDYVYDSITLFELYLRQKYIIKNSKYVYDDVPDNVKTCVEDLVNETIEMGPYLF